MNKLPQTASIADLRNSHLAVLEKLVNGPVVINSRSTPVGVLISPQMWDRIAEHVEDLEDSLDALKMENAILRGEVETETLSEQEIAEWLAEDETVSA